MLEQQFMGFLVDRLDAKLDEMKEVELQTVVKPAQEMKVYIEQLRSVIGHLYGDDSDEPRSIVQTQPQNLTTTPNATRRRTTRTDKQNTAD